MASSFARLVMVPELVADHHWLASVSGTFPQTHCVTLPQPLVGEPLADYANRCLEPLISNHIISHEEAWMVGGTGWGGSLAVEMGIQAIERKLAPRAALLIGSCRSRERIPSLLRYESSVMTRMPQAILGPWAMRRWLGWYPEIKRLRPEMREILRPLRSNLPYDRLRWAVHAIAHWSRTRKEVDESGLVIHQIHGRLDAIAIPPGIDDATILLHGNHLLHLSLTEELDRWLDAILRDDQLKREFAAK